MRVLASTCGVNMNTWFVGNHPVGHLVIENKGVKSSKKGKSAKSSTSEKEIEPKEDAPSRSNFDKTFFMKARIMAGQADVSNASGTEDFKWLAKDEIQRVFDSAYWSRVKNILVEQ